MRRGDAVVAWATGLALVVLHHDVYWQGPRGVVAGALPVELLWRVAWMLLAAAWIWFFTARVWRADEERDA